MDSVDSKRRKSVLSSPPPPLRPTPLTETEKTHVEKVRGGLQRKTNEPVILDSTQENLTDKSLERFLLPSCSSSSREK